MKERWKLMIVFSLWGKRESILIMHGLVEIVLMSLAVLRGLLIQGMLFTFWI